MDGVHGDGTQCVRGADFVGHGQADDIGSVVERAGVVAEDAGGGEGGMVGLQSGLIACDDEESAGSERGVGREVE